MAFLGRFLQLFVSLIFSFVVAFSARYEKMAAMSVRQVAPMYGQGEVVLGVGSARIGPSSPECHIHPGNKVVLRDHEGKTLGGTGTLRFSYLPSPGCNRHRQDDIVTGCS